jgi:putative Mg2+ transporter-C (MgtC) family protein
MARVEAGMPSLIHGIVAQVYATELEHVVRLAASVALGGLVGLERELRDKPAGFRTIILISVGACLFTILSQVLGGPDWDSTRIAAQIVTGIGFLGAGAILRDRTGVIGLTTAATIWSVAAVGMASGFGYLGLASAGTAAILLALLGFDIVEKRIGARRDLQAYHFAAPKADDALRRIRAMFDRANLKIRKWSCHEDEDLLVFHIWAMGGKPEHDSLRMSLALSDEYHLRRV